ncbi:MAG: hypothetical protein JSU92_09540, partial [Deltaproteobacteria bacterium]
MKRLYSCSLLLIFISLGILTACGRTPTNLPGVSIEILNSDGEPTDVFMIGEEVTANIYCEGEDSGVFPDSLQVTIIRDRDGVDIYPLIPINRRIILNPDGTVQSMTISSSTTDPSIYQQGDYTAAASIDNSWGRASGEADFRVEGEVGVSITSPEQGDCINTMPVTVTGTFDGFPDASLVEVLVNGVDATETVLSASTGSYTAVILFLPEGPQTITAVASDGTYTDTDSIPVFVDTVPPVVTISAPSPNECINTSTVVVSGTATDLGQSFGLPTNITVTLDCSNEGALTVPIVGGNWIATFTVPASGSCTAVASIQDDCGNTGSDSVPFSVDIDPPTVNVNPIIPPCSTTGNVTVSATCFDADSGVASCEVSIDGGANWFPSPHLYIGLITGGYTAIGQAADNCGNTAQDLVGEPFEVDVDLPTVDVLSIPCSTTGNVTVTATCDDVGSGLASCQVSIDNINWFDSPNLYIGLPDGPYTAYGRATDNCGNTATDPSPEQFEVDTVAVVTITSPPDGSTVVLPNVLVNGTADIDIDFVTVITDQGHNSGPITVVAGNWSVVLTGVTVPQPLPEILMGITASGIDNCGNTGITSVTVTVERPPCVITSVGPTTGCAGVAVNITGSNFGPNTGTVTFNGTTATVTSWTNTSITVEAPGGDYAIVTVYPATGGSCTLADVYSYDDDPPTVNITSPADGATLCTTTVVIVGSCTDPAPGTGIATCVVEVDGVTGDLSDGTETFVVAGTGVYTATLTGVDNCGYGATTTISFEVDVTPPTALLTQPAEGETICTSQVVVQGNCADIGFGLAAINGCVVEVDGLTADLSGGITTFSLADGYYTATLTATDICALSSSTTFGFLVDTTPPAVNIASPADGATFCTTTVVIVGSCTDPVPGSGLATCVIEVDGVTGDLSDGTETFVVPVTGAYTATLTGVDNCGHGATTTISFEVDVTPPWVSITSPADGATFCTSTVTVTTTFVDIGFGVARAVLEVDGITADITSGTATVTGLITGSYTATVTAYDQCDLSNVDSITFSVDLEPPTVEITSPADGATFCTTTIVIVGSCTDIGFGISTCVVAVTGGLGGDMSDGNETIIVPGSGVYTATLTGLDSCGYGATTTISFFVDVTPPNVTINSPTDGECISNTTVVVSGTAEDGTGTGIAAVYVNGLTASGTDSWSITFTSDQYGVPVEVGSLGALGESYRVYVTGGYAYVADGDSGLAIIDVS